jgi:hypothetical protein
VGRVRLNAIEQPEDIGISPTPSIGAPFVR